MLDRAQGRSTGTAIMARNLDHVGVGFGDPSGNGADANFRHQLHRHPRFGIDLVEVKNQLGQIFNGVDVVVGGRRNQGHPRFRPPQHRNVRADFLAR